MKASQRPASKVVLGEIGGGPDRLERAAEPGCYRLPKLDVEAGRVLGLAAERQVVRIGAKAERRRRLGGHCPREGQENQRCGQGNAERQPTST
jgi:hypothetical protein